MQDFGIFAPDATPTLTELHTEEAPPESGEVYTIMAPMKRQLEKAQRLFNEGSGGSGAGDLWRARKTFLEVEMLSLFNLWNESNHDEDSRQLARDGF